ncbi:MAG: hypothetical protein K8U57_28785 [Planctomycetes bacterium]|nr:hypothetical protein [Planctomycetota bacterium]
MIVFAVFLLPIPVNLDTLSVERARDHHDKLVVASFLAMKPAFTWRDNTVLGAADYDEFVERGAVLQGNWLNAEGKRVTVVGTVRVIRHRACVVEGVAVPEWIEIRVSERCSD